MTSEDMSFSRFCQGIPLSVPFRYYPAIPMRVTFIGAGAIGSAVAGLVKTSGARVELWDVDPARVPDQRPLEKAVPGADVLFLCVCSWQLRDAVAQIRPLLSKKTVVVSLSKGIELGTRFTVDRLLADALPKRQPFALLSGPMLAAELAAGLPSGAAVASTSRAAGRRVERLFARSALLTEWTNDVRSVALAGVLKNIYALGLGITDALELGANARGRMVECATEEMVGVIKKLHPRGDAVRAALGPAGLGDLVATGTSPHSSNRRVGHELVAGKGMTKMSEGFMSLPSLLSLLGKKRAAKFPLLQAVGAVVISKKDARRTFRAFLSRQ